MLGGGGRFGVSAERVVWRVAGAASRTPTARPPPPLPAGSVRILTRERGQEKADLPIFTAAPGSVALDASHAGPSSVGRQDVPGVPGAFVLTGVCTPSECAALVAASESMGYTEDAPVSLGRDVRRNTNCVWVVDGPTLLGPLFERCAPLLPTGEEWGLGGAVGLNARWRLYRYDAASRDIFRPHTDGSWPGSGVVDGELVWDRYQDGRWSALTWLLYLNDGFEGGETTFFTEGGAAPVAVAPSAGSVLCFWHGEHPLSPLHEGSLVTEGTKYVARSDVLYTPAGRRG